MSPRLANLMRSRSRRAANRVLATIEELGSWRFDTPLPHAVLLIVGAPRSGSTLLYQLMTERYDLGYLANAHCRWHGGPAAYERLRRPLRGRKHSDFRSDHGQTAQPWGPSECGGYWYRFFPREPHYVSGPDFADRDARRLRASVRALTRAFGRPLLFKNLYCTLRMVPIARALPEALFVVIERDEIDNAHSLLQGRMSRTGDYATWWSARPPDIDSLLMRPPHEQVVEQVRSIGRMVERDARAIGGERVLTVCYEELCDDAAGVLATIERFAAARGVQLARRDVDLPVSFPRSTAVCIDGQLYGQLVEYARATSAPSGVAVSGEVAP